jgi:hypothetical protein
VIDVKGIYGSGVRGVQVMSGVHLQTSQLINPKKVPLLKHISGLSRGISIYGDFRVGGNMQGVCYEIASGVNLTKKFFVGLAYNHQGGDYYGDVDLDMKYMALRTGFNF